MVIPQKGTWEAEFKNGKLDGQAGFHGLEGINFVFQFRAGLPDGPITMTFKNGGVINGVFKQGLPEGKWTHTAPDGKKEEMDMKDDGLKDLTEIMQAMRAMVNPQ